MNKEQNIPNSWIQVPLLDLFLDPKNNIVDGPFGSNLKASEYQDEGVPIIRIQNIDRSRFIDKNIQYVTREKAEFLSRHSFKSGDIIITKLGEPLGKACLVPEKFKHGIIVADLIRARIDHRHINKKFLLYQLNSSDLIKQFDKYTKGTTRQRIKLSAVRDLMFNLPPLNEQNRIVDAIEELFSDLDSSVENLKLAQNQLKVYRQTLLKHAFEGKFTRKWRNENRVEPKELLLKGISEERQNHYEQQLIAWEKAMLHWENGDKKGKKPIKPRNQNNNKRAQIEDEILPEIPKNWAYVRLEDLSYLVTDGTHHTPKYVDNGVKFLSVKNIRPLVIHDSAVKHITQEEHSELIKRCHPEKGDILYTKIGATFGYAAQVKLNYEFSIFVSLCLIKPVKKFISSSYLEILMNSEVVFSQARKRISGTAVPDLHLIEIRDFKIPICSIKEQEVIVNQLEEYLSVISNLEQTIEIHLKQSETLRLSILKNAFEGKLVTQNPKDEPATTLLKHIQIEKEQYLQNQKLQKQNSPKKLRKMIKELSIEEVLKASDSPMLSKDVWEQSKHKGNIEEFYAELKKIKANIKEVKKGTESLLTFIK